VAPKLQSVARVRQKHHPERRVADRRKNSRGGRRRTDPRKNWRRLAWLFAAYATFLSLRSLPESLRRMFNSRTPA
jgi:hypothetical protein